MFTISTLNAKKLHPEAKLPTRATEYDAGYDLYALEDGEIYPNQHAMIPTGIAIRMPQLPYPFKVFGSMRSRSSLSAKHNLEVGAGVVDLGYNGELKVILHNHNQLGCKIFRYKKHDRIAQIILQVHITPDVEEVEEFPELENNNRGECGFGSTGL